jgi:hypothetical protein
MSKLDRLESVARDSNNVKFMPKNLTSIENHYSPETILQLISALKTAREALESIASLHNPSHSKESYWLNKASHESCADCLSGDTVIAREALATLSSVCEGKEATQYCKNTSKCVLELMDENDKWCTWCRMPRRPK